jgi:hypothetical protein
MWMDLGEIKPAPARGCLETEGGGHNYGCPALPRQVDAYVVCLLSDNGREHG